MIIVVKTCLIWCFIFGTYKNILFQPVNLHNILQLVRTSGEAPINGFNSTKHANYLVTFSLFMRFYVLKEEELSCHIPKLTDGISI